MQTPYLMIAGSGDAEMVVRKSRFIGHAARATTEAEARAAIDAIASRHWDANHNCHAWSLGERPRLQRSSDDGEPSGTAGIPILEVLKQRDLTDTVVVVTRYFGGIKLGAGGLIRAYSHTASAVIDQVGIVERKTLARLAVTVTFDDAGRLDNGLRAIGHVPDDVDYGASATFTITLDPAQQPDLVAWVAEQTSGRATINELDAAVAEVPFTPAPASGRE